MKKTEDDSILESQEYQEVTKVLSFGPLYDYLLADIENPEYIEHPGHIESIESTEHIVKKR